MNRRIYALGLTVLLSGFAVIGSAQPQPAPPPRPVAPMTTEEMVIGDWNLVRIGQRPFGPEVKLVLSFARDGKYRSVYKGNRPIEVTNGKYTIVGDVLTLKSDTPLEINALRSSIITITNDKLILGPIDSIEKNPHELSRLTK